MKITDEQGNEVPAGEVGEIWMKPPDDNPTYRYIGAEARARDGWESIGDLGWMDDDGYLYLADRRTDLILAGGANIYPAEVEAALMEHPLVVTCAVIGLPDEDLGQRVHAVLEVSGEVSDDELREFLGERLVRYKVPRSFERVEGQVRDDAGKVRRGALAAERSRGGRRKGISDMSDTWETVGMSDVGPGDRVRYRDYEFTIARVDRAFLGMDTMVCLIEDEPTRWFAYPGPEGRPDRGAAVVVSGTWHEGDVRIDDATIHYYRRGSGPPVVLAHGALDDGRCWTRVAEALESEYDLIAYDARVPRQVGRAGERHAARRRRPRRASSRRSGSSVRTRSGTRWARARWRRRSRRVPS